MRVWRETRGNILVELLKVAGGSTVVTAIFHAIFQEYRRAPIDWLLLAGWIVGGIVMTIVAYRLQHSSDQRLERRLQEHQAEIKKSIPLFMVNGVPISDPAVATATSGSPLFSPLQMEAFQLARELRSFLEPKLGEEKNMRFLRIRLEYEEKFAPKVKSLMFKFAREHSGEDSTLRRFDTHVDHEGNVLTVINSLIRLSHLQDGIDIDLRYPS